MIIKLLRLEGLFIFLLATFLFFKLGGNWLIFILFLFTPDISMIGYLKNKKIGAITYNLVHNLALSFGLILIGYLLNFHLILFAGLILTAHIGIDRSMGYGLKETSGFKDTHLGKIGK